MDIGKPCESASTSMCLVKIQTVPSESYGQEGCTAWSTLQGEPVTHHPHPRLKGGQGSAGVVGVAFGVDLIQFPEFEFMNLQFLDFDRGIRAAKWHI